MKMLDNFKEFLKESGQREQFEKMFYNQHANALDECHFSTRQLFFQIAWELLIAQDRIVKLESQVNSIADCLNKTPEPPKA